MFFKALPKGSRKKSSSLNGLTIIRPKPLPPPLELNGREKFWNVRKKGFLNGPAVYPPLPLLMAQPLREELFFCGFPEEFLVVFHSMKLK